MSGNLLTSDFRKLTLTSPLLKINWYWDFDMQPIGNIIVSKNHFLFEPLISRLWIIEGYVVGFSFHDSLIIESDSLMAAKSLSPQGEYFYELGACSLHFLNSIDSTSIVFSHVYTT